MTSLAVYNRNGKKVGTYKVDSAEFTERINKQLLHDAVVMYQANLRQGSAKSKSRSQVSGSTRKLYRQKGTGNARAGSRRSGIRRGGGHIHAKHARNWSYRLPRKALQLATRMALASRIRDEEVTVIDELGFDVPKTKEMVDLLKALGLSDTRLLVTTAAHEVNVYKSARNITDVSVSPASELNALTVMAPRRLLMTKEALDAIRQRYATAEAPKK